MPDRAPAWVVPAMRIGYGGRGLVYLLVGVLAVLAAWRGGQAEGATGALQQLEQHWWGPFTLVAIAIGMFCYAAWRVIDGFMDLESYGTGARGMIARTGLVVTGLIHLALGVYVVWLLTGGSGDGASGEARGITTQLMQQSWGRWAIGIAGLCTIGGGVYYFVKGHKEKYRERIRLTRTTELLNPAMKAGLYAHGIVLVLIGFFIFWAAWTHDPSEAGGLAKAFESIRSAAFGRILLGLVAMGLIGFCVLCFVNAIYRIVPRRAGDDVSTLASSVAAKAAAWRATARRSG